MAIYKESMSQECRWQEFEPAANGTSSWPTFLRVANAKKSGKSEKPKHHSKLRQIIAITSY